MKTIREEEKNTPVACEVDICVVGGSCTGVFAAVRAARLGAKVAIVENNGFFGGVATAGLVTVWHSAFDMAGKRQIVAGLSLETIDRLRTRKAVEETHPPNQHKAYVFNPEELKIELDELIVESGVRPFLHARFVDAVHNDGQVTAAIIEDKTGRRAIQAKCFIDATGDGDLIARMGLPSTTHDELQPPTTVAMVDNYAGIGRQTPGFSLSDEVHNPKYPNALRRGFLWGTNVVGRPESFMIAGTRAHNADCSDGDSLTLAEIECRRQVRSMCDILRDNIRGAENLTLANLASCIGVRETRHARCLYTLKESDILGGTRFDDAIGYGTYGCDTHHSDKPGITMKYLDGTQRYAEPGKESVWSRWRDESAGITPFYQIPYRSLIPEATSNVLVAGRLIGADKVAYGAIRVMMNCNQTGEAAGVACSIALQENVPMSQVPVDLLRARLAEGGSVLPRNWEDVRE